MTSAPANDEAAMGQRLLQSADIVEKWAKWTRTHHPVQPGSSLAADDALFPLNPVSDLAWFGIAHAVDHLGMHLHVLVRDELSFPIAPQTLARGGLVGAAHALWLLDGPDRRTRQLRALRIAHEEWRNERNAYQGLVDAGEAEDGMDALIVRRTEWINRAIAAGESIGSTPAEVKMRPNDTALIGDVLTRYESHEPGEPGDIPMAPMYKLLWQMLSGSAHGYRWSSMNRVQYAEGMEGETAHGLLTTDLETHFHSVGALMLLIERAFDLFNKRRIRHT